MRVHLLAISYFQQGLDIKSLTKLNFTKNAEGEYHCPVLYKSFFISSHIVAIKTTGNVFLYEVKQLVKLYYFNLLTI